MLPYILRRLLWTVPVLFAVSLITFALMHSVEGGPWDEEKLLPETVAQNLDHRYGLDAPVLEQYGRFVWNALQGDLGVSFQQRDRPVTDIIMEGFRVSAVLGGVTLLVAIAAGVSLGVASAVNRGGPVDHMSVILATAGSSVPGFVVAIGLIYVFGVELRWLPVLGWGSLEQAVLPVVTLSLTPAAILARLTRAGMLEALQGDYIRTARAKGLPASAVLRRHALRNAMFPVLSALGPLTAGLVTGSFIVEQLFSIPGLGRAFVHSVTARDYGMIMGTTLFLSVVIAAANLAVDIAYGLADPRLRDAGVRG